MSETVIRVENLSKLYRLGELHKQTGSCREKVTNSFKRLWKSNRYRLNQSNKTGNTNNESPMTKNGLCLIDEAFKVLDGKGKKGNCPRLWDGKASERIVKVLVNSNPTFILEEVREKSYSKNWV